MKEIMKSIYKKLAFKMFIILCLVALNVYLLTCPSKILGKIIDLLGNIEQNKTLIIDNIKLLLLVSFVFILTRIVWKYLLAFVTRQVEKNLKDKLFNHFLKIKLRKIFA